MSDINPWIKEVCREHIRKIDQPFFELNVEADLVNNSDNNFLILPISTIVQENILDEIDTESDLNKTFRKMDYEKSKEIKVESMIISLYKKKKNSLTCQLLKFLLVKELNCWFNLKHYIRFF